MVYTNILYVYCMCMCNVYCMCTMYTVWWSLCTGSDDNASPKPFHRTSEFVVVVTHYATPIGTKKGIVVKQNNAIVCMHAHTYCTSVVER